MVWLLSTLRLLLGNVLNLIMETFFSLVETSVYGSWNHCFPMFNLNFSTVFLYHVMIFQDVLAANRKFVGNSSWYLNICNKTSVKDDLSPSSVQPLVLGFSYLIISHMTAEKNTKVNPWSVKNKTTNSNKPNKQLKCPPPYFFLIACC